MARMTDQERAASCEKALKADLGFLVGAQLQSITATYDPSTGTVVPALTFRTPDGLTWGVHVMADQEGNGGGWIHWEN
jgi:hypothetical protein